MEQLRQQHQADKTVLRLSMDAKATVLIGDYRQGGKSRLVVKAADHDFHRADKVTPYGIFLLDYDHLFLYFTRSPITSDFIVDCLLDCWTQLAPDFPGVQTLVLYCRSQCCQVHDLATAPARCHLRSPALSHRCSSCPKKSWLCLNNALNGLWVWKNILFAFAFSLDSYFFEYLLEVELFCSPGDNAYL